MEAKDEESVALNTTMSNEETTAPEKVPDGKAKYKSFKKKYRKMRMVFDEKMRLSNSLYMDEQHALATAKRMAQMNNQIMDLLLDVNECAQIPADKRYDLSVESPILSAIPPLITPSELSKAAELNTPQGKAIYDEIRLLLAEQVSAKDTSKPPKSLGMLLSTIPHLSLNNPHVSAELVASLNTEDPATAPLRFLTMDQIEEYLYEIDSTIGHVPPIPPQQVVTERDLPVLNPHSVYNWLRKHEPKVFLQDGEGSEKSSGKPGALRGAGKRASIPAPAKPDTLEFVEEDVYALEAPIVPTSTKGKRKRDGDDDGGYHPKSGRVDDGKGKKPRQARKKKTSDESTPSTSSRKKKAKASSPAPEGHPFGPL